MISILHLSDFHFTKANPNWKIDYNFLKNDISEQYEKENLELKRNPNKYSQILKKPDIIVVSGDISNNGSDYDIAISFLNELVTDFLEGNKNQMIIVPGNHDVNWNDSTDAFEEIPYDKTNYETLKNTNGIKAKDVSGIIKLFRKKDENKYALRFINFAKFYSKFYEGKKHYPLETELEYLIHDFSEEYNLVLVGFNSCLDIDHLSNIPSVPATTLINARSFLDNNQNKTAARIAIWHHGIGGKTKDRSYLDEEEVTEQLILNKFSLLLHGHLHKNQYKKIEGILGDTVPVIGCGTFGANAKHRPESVPFQYNLITLDMDKSTGFVNTRKRDNNNQPWTADRDAGGFSFYPFNLPKTKEKITIVIGPKNGNSAKEDKITSNLNDLSKEEYEKCLDEVIFNETVYGISDVRFLVGSERNIIHVFRKIHDNINIRIDGSPGIGKTSLLKALTDGYIHKWIRTKINGFNPSKYIFVFINMLHVFNPSDFFEKVIEQIKIHLPGYTDLGFQEKYRDLSNILISKNKKVVLLLDNFESILKIEQFDISFINYLQHISYDSSIIFVHTHKTGKVFTSEETNKMWYLKTLNYDLKYFSKKDFKEFFAITFRYYKGSVSIEECRYILSFLGGVHPLFLTIARRILFDNLHCSQDIKVETEILFMKTVYGQYMYLLKDLHYFDHKRLFLHLTREEPLEIYSHQILKLGILDNRGQFNLFSEHFTNFYIETYYPTYIDK